MQDFIDAVRKSVAAEHWHAALALALTLPDICGALDDPTAGSQARYRHWWLVWAQPLFTAQVGAERVPHVFLGSGDAYAFRCAYLHAGSDLIDDQRASDCLKSFLLTYGTNIHMNQNGDVLQLDVGQFSISIADAVERWLRVREADPLLAGRLEGLISLTDARGGFGFGRPRGR
jgi:hypothetical protein